MEALSALQKALRALTRPHNYVRGANLQEHADLLRLYLLTGAREWWPNPMPPPDLDSLPPPGRQREVVHERIYLQATTLLQRWHRERPSPLPPESLSKPLAAERRAELAAERAAEVNEAQRRAFGFELRVGPSKAGPSAGNGVFLHGSAPPGSVLLFWPGVSYEPADLLLLPGGTRAFEGNEYLMARFDRSIIDASETAQRTIPQEALECPLSAAHIVNHPPSGARPNVMPAPIDWNVSVPRELLTLLPNVSYHRSASAQRLLAGSAYGTESRALIDVFRASLADSLRRTEPEGGPVLRGLAFIAAREVRDEELYLNYRLNPRNGYPSWYSPVDREEDARRWQ